MGNRDRCGTRGRHGDWRWRRGHGDDGLGTGVGVGQGTDGPLRLGVEVRGPVHCLL